MRANKAQYVLQYTKCYLLFTNTEGVYPIDTIATLKYLFMPLSGRTMKRSTNMNKIYLLFALAVGLVIGAVFSGTIPLAHAQTQPQWLGVGTSATPTGANNSWHAYAWFISADGRHVVYCENVAADTSAAPGCSPQKVLP